MIEKYKDCEFTRGLKKNEEFSILKYIDHYVKYCEDIQFLVGDKENPIVSRRKIGKGFVYSICTNSHNMPECFISDFAW